MHGGVTLTTADLAIVYTVANSVGPITMISGGWFNDKFGPRKVILIGGIMIGIAGVGLSFGSFMGVYPGFTADQFGAKNNSVNYGIMFIGLAAAGYFGPSAMRSIYMTDGAYARAFLIAAACGAVGFVLTFIYRIFAKKSN